MLQRFENHAVLKAMHNSMYCSGHEPLSNDVKILEQFVEDSTTSLQEMKFLTPCVSFLRIFFSRFYSSIDKLQSAFFKQMDLVE